MPRVSALAGCYKQAPRAWYDELSNFLMSKGFTKGIIDPTLFKIKYGEDILLVQIYVDDIIFGSTNPKYSKRFDKLMHSRFEMSLMGEHNMENCHSIGTPLATKPKLDVDLSGEPVDQSDYRSKIGSLMYLTSSRPELDVDLSGEPVDQSDYCSKIGSLMYLTSSRPDLVQEVCYCARYQARPT
ncbi:retrovirus-related pol polyprotein from transposon TNT 1-94 [Tanacetum coccineum]